MASMWLPSWSSYFRVLPCCNYKSRDPVEAALSDYLLAVWGRRLPWRGGHDGMVGTSLVLAPGAMPASRAPG